MTAAELYKARQQEIAFQIKSLKAALAEHAKKFDKSPKNWGLVGDLGQVKQDLSVLDGFLKSTK